MATHSLAAFMVLGLMSAKPVDPNMTPEQWAEYIRIFDTGYNAMLSCSMWLVSTTNTLLVNLFLAMGVKMESMIWLDDVLINWYSRGLWWLMGAR
jgi:hypothetical protein